jgi:hypothetical protein
MIKFYLGSTLAVKFLFLQTDCLHKHAKIFFFLFKVLLNEKKYVS